jgi:hypothetical protein
MDTDIVYILQQAVEEGIIVCPECGDEIEPDCPECFCGWENPLLANGYI